MIFFKNINEVTCKKIMGFGAKKYSDVKVLRKMSNKGRNVKRKKLSGKKNRDENVGLLLKCWKQMKRGKMLYKMILKKCELVACLSVKASYEF